MTVIITGAAGSIGRAVCEKLVRSGVKSLVLVDIAETPLFWLAGELQRAPGVEVRAVIGNVTNRDGMAHLFQQVAPTAVIHCAALKHVGMCEQNVCEAVLTNVWGSWVIAELSALAKARCVVVSTDKAVNPISIMGMTKALAEWIVAGFADTRIVRLVNVRGSAGSVEPIFERQIAAGGPVTVTHQDAFRFFMSAEEAANVVWAQTLGETLPEPAVTVPFHLKAENISELASRMIGASGKVGVSIKFIGLRDGEKLVEEIASAAELELMGDRNWFEPGRSSWVIGGAAQQLMAVVNQRDEAGARQLLTAIMAEHY